VETWSYFELKIEWEEPDIFEIYKKWIYLTCSDDYNYFNYDDDNAPYITSFKVGINNYYC